MEGKDQESEGEGRDVDLRRLAKYFFHYLMSHGILSRLIFKIIE